MKEIENLKIALQNKDIKTVSKNPSYGIHSETQISGFFAQYRFLSNFWPCPNGIEYEGTIFKSVEHAYQSAKFPKSEHYKLINISAGEIKKLGREVFLPNNWDTVKYDLMYDFVLQKFSKDENLKKLLINTGNKILDERNSWGDVYWGTNEQRVGKNNLGKILMKIRSELI